MSVEKQQAYRPPLQSCAGGRVFLLWIDGRPATRGLVVLPEVLPTIKAANDA